MAKLIFSEEQAAEILTRLLTIETALKVKQQGPDNTFFDNQEFMQIMNISKRCAQSWRDQRLIGFSQVGSKLYYRLSDILIMLQKHRIEPKQ